MSEPRGLEPTPPPPPDVDDPMVAEALAQVRDLDALPLAEHHDRLVQAHGVLHDALHPDVLHLDGADR